MAISPIIPVLATSSMVALPWTKVSLPPGMATPYWSSLTMSWRMAVLLSLRTALALALAIHSPLLISLGVIFPGFSRKLALDPRIHLKTLGSLPLPAM
eukprot:3519498-Heterocapsa_arctica.AAC.1